MSEKSKNVAIGAFVVGGVLIVVLTVLFFSLGSSFGSSEKVVMVFDGSVKGLNVGAPVALRGVKIGQVTKIEVILDANTIDLLMLVEADIYDSAIRYRGNWQDDDIPDDEVSATLVSHGLRAQLNTQSLLTGLLYIQFDFHPGSELKLVDVDSPYFQFPTIPTDIERITRKLADLDVSALIDDITGAMNSINTLVGAQNFQALPSSVTNAMDSLTGLSEELRQQLASTGPKLDTVLDETATTVAHANAELPKLSERISTNLERLDDAMAAFEGTLNGIEGIVDYDSATMYQLSTALQEMSRAGRSLQSLARTLEEQPESLVRGKSGEN